jgi:predicted SAM-dependent methyltransferase
MAYLKNLFKRFVKRLLLISYRIIALFYKPAYPSNPESKIFIHLGCGDINSSEYINVDSRPFPHIHHIHDVSFLPFFKDDFADLIYASHILEHIPMENLREVINEWKRVLKKGGILRIGVPDFDTILKIYRENNQSVEEIWRPLMGGQEYPQNFHYSVFNKEYLTKLFHECGFNKVNEWNPKEVEHHSFEDWTSYKYEVNSRVYPISLNLEAVK